MKISYNWLKKFIDLDLNPTKTAELLTDLGLEVEGMETFESIKGGLKGITVGHVIDCIKHPNADRLKVCQVDVGTSEALNIVCGAPNVDKGQKVAVATVGTTIFPFEGEPWTIKKGKIRGEESRGMICAEDELGLGTDHDGIMVLPEDVKPGTALNEVIKVETDTIFEIGLTPNRADAMSHFGVARDLKAGLERMGKTTKIHTPSVINFRVDERSLKLEVEVEDNKLAPRYCGVTLRNVLVQESPDWLKNRLTSIGLAPINNIVDITNFVLHELGQPLHAFDADKIKGRKVRVRQLPKGSKFMTLDGVERTLDGSELMICDNKDAMCIAGVFGGLNSGITEGTTSIFLESAYFDPVSIRKTAKHHGLSTDASFRFERGIDIETVEYALKRAALLIKEIAGGEIVSDIVDLYPIKQKENHVFLSMAKINSLVGQEIPQETIISILSSLDIKINNATEAGFGLTIPVYRNDVVRDVDVIEEILRIYGYNNVEFGQKITASMSTIDKYDNHNVQNHVGNYLANNGFFEIMTNSLVKGIDDELALNILNPLSAELGSLRTQMVDSGLQTVIHNLNRKRNNLKLFEFGKVYHQYGGQRRETQQLCLYTTGSLNDGHWNAQEKTADFYYLKGILDGCLDILGIRGIKIEEGDSTTISQGLWYGTHDGNLGYIGEIQHSKLAEHDIKQPVYMVCLDWDQILAAIPKKNLKVAEVPKFPEVKRDLALLVDHKTTFGEIEQLAYKNERKLLKKVTLFDVYTGKELPEGKKSYALSFALQDNTKTLTDKQIDKVMNKMQQSFSREFGAVVR